MSFRVYRSTTCFDEINGMPVYGTIYDLNTREFSDTDVEPGITYYCAVSTNTTTAYENPHIYCVGPIVDVSLVMTVTLLEPGEVGLEWSQWPTAVEYWIYGAPNEPYFEPGFSPDYEHRIEILPHPSGMWSSPEGVGAPYTNWTYLVIAVGSSENELARSHYGANMTSVAQLAPPQVRKSLVFARTEMIEAVSPADPTPQDKRFRFGAPSSNIRAA